MHKLLISTTRWLWSREPYGREVLDDGKFDLNCHGEIGSDRGVAADELTPFFLQCSTSAVPIITFLGKLKFPSPAQRYLEELVTLLR